MITVQELDDLTRDFLEKKEYEAKAKDRMKEIAAETKLAESLVINALQDLDKSENEGSFGKVKISQKEYFRATDKEACYAWLREQGEFEAIASVNANTLSSYVKELVHAKRDEGDFCWTPPGVEDATSAYTYLRITKK